MSKKGEVIYEVRADYDNLEKDLDTAQKKVEKSAQETSDTSEKIEKKTGETKKQVQEDVTKHNQEQNDKQVQSDDDAGKKKEESAKKHGESIKNIATVSAKAIGAGMLAVGTAAAGVGTMAVNSAVNMDQAMNQFIASTGKGKEETERYQNVLEDIYKNNYGESFDDIGNAMALVTKNLGDMDDAALKEVTESAFALQDVFECDIAESTRAAKAMMDNFGISGQDAMNLIATGAQNGLDFSEELIDSINEYSVHFAKVGLDADDMFKIMQKGADSGAFNLDKIGDAIKEMSIRVIDGSDTTKEGFKAIGLNADEMAAKFASGGDAAKEAFQQTMDALAQMKDPLEQNAAGVSLFGTMWEDLGADAVTALADIEDGAYATGEELNKIKEVKYDDLGSMFEGLKRSVEMLLLPLGEQLIPILSELIEAIMPIIEDVLPPLMDVVEQLLPPITEIIEKILPVITDLIKQLVPPMIEIISAVLPVLIELIDALLPIIQILLDLLMPLIDCFMDLLQPILSLIGEALTPLLKALTPVIEVITDLLIPILQVLLSVFTEVFSGIVQGISDRISRITSIINSVVDFVKNVFKGNWKGAWKNIVDIFKNIIGGIGDAFKRPINLLIDLINGFLKGISKIKIPDWVPGIGGKGFKMPTIPRLRVGMDYVPSDDFPALLHKGEAVLTAQENALYRSAGGFEGIIHTISERGYQDAHNREEKTIVIHSHVEIDGREVARSTAEYIGEQLPWEEL